MKNILLAVGMAFTLTLALGQEPDSKSIFVVRPPAALETIEEADGIESQGSPFIDIAFSEGSFKIKNTKYVSSLRFNIYLDAFEVQQEGSSLYINCYAVDTVYYNNSVFAYKSENNKLKAYEFLARNPKADLLKKYRVTYIEGRIGVKGKKNRYPRYKQESPEYFFQKTDGERLAVKGIKDFAKLFPEKKEDINAFIKTNKLKKKKEKDLISLFNHIALQL
jgi:hypothetical protein